MLKIREDIKWNVLGKYGFVDDEIYGRKVKVKKMINGYFYDMEEVIKNAFNALKCGGYCVIIVGNSAYTGHVIETDFLLAKIAERIGFQDIEINVARKLRASSQQAKILKDDKALRESVIIMKKP